MAYGTIAGVGNTLAHYLRMGLEAKGYTWDSDNSAEAQGIVEALQDLILEAADAKIGAAVEGATQDLQAQIRALREEMQGQILTDGAQLAEQDQRYQQWLERVIWGEQPPPSQATLATLTGATLTGHSPWQGLLDRIVGLQNDLQAERGKVADLQDQLKAQQEENAFLWAAHEDLKASHNVTKERLIGLVDHHRRHHEAPQQDLLAWLGGLYDQLDAILAQDPEPPDHPPSRGLGIRAVAIKRGQDPEPQNDGEPGSQDSDQDRPSYDWAEDDRAFEAAREISAASRGHFRD